MVRTFAYLGSMLLLGALGAVLPLLVGLGRVRPLFMVPLVVHLALVYVTTPGALMAVCAGLVWESTDALPPGVGIFGCVALFVTGKVALAGVKREGRGFSILLGAGGALVWHLLTGGAAALFGPVAEGRSWRESLVAAGWSMLATGLVSPLVVRLARRVDRLERRDAGVVTL